MLIFRPNPRLSMLISVMLIKEKTCTTAPFRTLLTQLASRPYYPAHFQLAGPAYLGLEHGWLYQPWAETIRLGIDTSSTAMGARTTSALKDLEHRNACLGLAGNNLELAGNGKPELQATAIRSRFSV